MSDVALRAFIFFNERIESSALKWFEKPNWVRWFMVALAVLFLSCSQDAKPAVAEEPNSTPQEAVFPSPESPPARHEVMERRLPSLEGGSISPIPVSGDVVPPEKLFSPGFDLAESGCDVSEPFAPLFELEIGLDGQVSGVKTLRPLPNGCLELHLTNVLSTWRYRPATLNGEPVSVLYNVTFTIHYR